MVKIGYNVINVKVGYINNVLMYQLQKIIKDLILVINVLNVKKFKVKMLELCQEEVLLLELNLNLLKKLNLVLFLILDFNGHLNLNKLLKI
jgi:hypothetical protein